MTGERTLWESTGRSPLAVGIAVLTIGLFLTAVLSMMSGEWNRAVRLLIAGGIAGLAGFLNYRRALGQRIVLSGRNLIVDDRANEPLEIGIESARVRIVRVPVGDDFRPMHHTIDFPEVEGIPHRPVLVIDHDDTATELFMVSGLVPVKMRQLRDDINAALIHARTEYNYPEPPPADGDT